MFLNQQAFLFLSTTVRRNTQRQCQAEPSKLPISSNEVGAEEPHRMWIRAPGARLSPSVMIEFTATPVRSNVIVSATTRGTVRSIVRGGEGACGLPPGRLFARPRDPSPSPPRPGSLGSPAASPQPGPPSSWFPPRCGLNPPRPGVSPGSSPFVAELNMDAHLFLSPSCSYREVLS